MLRKTVVFDGFLVEFGAVALVAVKTVPAVRMVKFNHQSIAINLGNNGSGRYAGAFPIAGDYRFLATGNRRDRQAVYKHHIRATANPRDGALHGAVCGHAYVYGINNVMIYNFHANGDSMGSNFQECFFAL